MGLQEMLSATPNRTRHLKVQTSKISLGPAFNGVVCSLPSTQGWNDAVSAEPVAHHQTVPAPLSAQHLAKEEIMGRAEDFVDLVVGRHESPGIAVSNGNLKRLEVYFS